MEPNPELFNQLLSKQRKSWAMNVCISTGAFVETVDFDASGYLGGIIRKDAKPSDKFYDVR